MSELLSECLEQNGFERKMTFKYSNTGKVEVEDLHGDYVNKSFDPVPIVNIRYKYAKIGSLHWKICDLEDLNKFISKAIPTYCDFL